MPDVSLREETMNRPKYIDATLLEPGDVLLVKSAGKGSDIITKATGGAFSHAALCLGTSTLFEALPSGLQFSSLNMVKAEKHGLMARTRLLCSTDAYEEFGVYRCPKEFQQHPDEDRVARTERLIRILMPLHGLEYPQLYRLADAAPILSRAPQWKKAILKVAGTIVAGDSKKTVPGPFCSELVVQALTSFGFSILKSPLDAREVAPADLADPNVSNLVQVDNAICEMDETILNELGFLEMMRKSDRIKPDFEIFQSVLKTEHAMDEIVARWRSFFAQPRGRKS